MKFLAAVATLGAVVLGSNPVRASENFPTAIQEAAGIPCTPSCTLCHGVDPGTASTFMNKQLGKALFVYNGKVVGPGDADALKANFAAYAMDPANAANVAALKAGTDPENGAALCSGGPTYGCGAHVASKAPPRDFSAALWVVGAVSVSALLRRRRFRPR